MKRRISQASNRVLFVVIFLVFLILFVYSSLNLKNIDYGYRMQELKACKKKLIEEIDQLKAKKSSLLNLKKVERIAMERLGYQYPEPDQIIKVIKRTDEDQ